MMKQSMEPIEEEQVMPDGRPQLPAHEFYNYQPAPYENIENEEAYIGEFSQEYMNNELFKMLDTNGNGKVERDDLKLCARSMGWTEQ